MFGKNLVDKVKGLNFPAGRYVVVGGGILAALGIRDTSDIDIAVMPELYAKLRSTGEWQEEERYGKLFLMQDDVDIIPRLDWEGYSTTTKDAIASAVIIDGVPFMNLEELKKFKKALGREKDAADEKLIEQYLAGQRGKARR